LNEYIAIARAKTMTTAPMTYDFFIFSCPVRYFPVF
jgi:hypothetical protein